MRIFTIKKVSKEEDLNAVQYDLEDLYHDWKDLKLKDMNANTISFERPSS